MVVTVLLIFAMLCLWRAHWLIKNPEQAQQSREKREQKLLDLIQKDRSAYISPKEQAARDRHTALLLTINAAGIQASQKD